MRDDVLVKAFTRKFDEHAGDIIKQVMRVILKPTKKYFFQIILAANVHKNKSMGGGLQSYPGPGN